MSRSSLAAFWLVSAALVAGVHTQAGDDVPPASFADPQRREKLARAFPELERIARRWLDERRAPGLAWGVVIDGELATFGSAGYRDIERRQPVDADTVFRIASMTKSFTALAILILRDEGKLELDAPAARYVPELASLAPPTRDAPAITVRHLLTHTAGFPEDNPWGDRQLAITDGELSRWLAAGIPFSTATGSAYEYSNYGFAMLGRIVANVSGMPCAQFVDRRILEPLGMKSTYWEVKDVPPARLAIGYRIEDGRQVRETPLGDGAFGAMGGLHTSSRDLARWVAWMLAAYPPRDDPESPPALRRSVREMQQAASPPYVFTRPSFGTPPQAFANAYAFGLGTLTTCDRGTLVHHSGGLPGFGSNMGWLPEYGVGAFAMANLTYASPGAMLRDMLEALARTGGLEPRRPRPSPALVEMTHRLTDLIDSWNDDDARSLAANNLFLDESLQRRRASLQTMRKDLGDCTAGDIAPENALRGTFRMSCERGWLDVRFTLAPVKPPRVQHLEITTGRPLTASMRATFGSVLEAMSRGPRGLDLAGRANREAIGAQLTAARERYGQCRIGTTEEGDGERNARVRFDCDRGPVDVALTRAAGKIESLELTPPPRTACPP